MANERMIDRFLNKAASLLAGPLVLVLLGAVLALPVVVTAMPESVRIPVVNDHDGDPAEAALFSHWEHNQFKCFACHDAIFPQKKLGFTHDDMDEKKYCAACHDGRTAFSHDDEDIECEVCHVPN